MNARQVLIMPRSKTPLILLLLGLAACAPTLQLEGTGAATPYRISDQGRILVEAEINGEGPVLLALDTGASISTLFDPAAENLGLQPIADQTVLIHGLVSSGRYPLLQIDSLALGEAAWIGPRIAGIPGNTAASEAIDGLLGIDFLRNYAVGFLAGARVLYLYPPDAVAAPKYVGWASIPLQSITFGEGGASLYYLALRMGNVALPALFDLGSSENVLNWPAVDVLDLRPLRNKDRRLLSGALESTRVAARFKADSVSTHGVSWLNEEFLVADLQIFATLGKEDAPFVILGSGLFNQRDFIIDFRRSRLLVRTAMAELMSEPERAEDTGVQQ
jgi:hypothetical protein